MKTNKTVGLAIGNSGETLELSSASVANGILKYAAENGWELIDLRSWHWNIPSGAKVDGLICDSRTQDHRQSLLRDIPLSVQIDPLRNLPAVRGVAADLVALGRMAGDYFLERGFRSFGLAAYRTDEWVGSLKAFKERIEKSGGTCQTIRGMHLPNDILLTTVRESVRQQLRELTYPLGIFCANDRLAVRLCRWCIEEGIAVPEQAAILGFGNDTIACLSSPVPLSSICPDYEWYGTEAAKLLQRMMVGKAVPRGTIVRIPPKVVLTRRSTDIMAIADPGVARALRYIWDHYRNTIGPDDVADFCGLPRRSLDRHFKKAVGRTVMKEVMRQRLRKACELLVAGDTPSVDIAAHLGFGTPQYFNYQFKKKFGIPPQAYRAREREKG